MEFDECPNEAVDEAIWLVPGIIPEPYWDYNMGQEFNFNTIKLNLNRSIKTVLKDEEQRVLIKGLKTDPELVFHIGMNSQKLPSLVLNNASIAHELLICMTNTQEITKYYDALSQMKLSPNSLEVFNRLSGIVDLPQEFI